MNSVLSPEPSAPGPRCPTCRLPVGTPPAAGRGARLVERLVPSFNSGFVIWAALVLSAGVAGSLEFMTHLAVARLHTPLAYHAFIDASVIALMSMALVGVCITSVRTRRKAVIQQIRAVEQLNHHLRNALQVIAQSRYLPEEKQAQAVFDSMDRIEEALRLLENK